MAITPQFDPVVQATSDITINISAGSNVADRYGSIPAMT